MYVCNYAACPSTVRVKEPDQQINESANRLINWQINQPVYYHRHACLLFYSSTYNFMVNPIKLLANH